MKAFLGKQSLKYGIIKLHIVFCNTTNQGMNPPGFRGAEEF